MIYVLMPHSHLDYMRVLAIRAASAAVLCVQACSAPRSQPMPAVAPDTLVLGEFQDDYGGRHTVSATEWVQHPRANYRIVSWRPDAQYLIAQNDQANASDPGLWTRIDWLRLSGMPPYEWGFCFSAYKAPTAAAAESTMVAKRDTPRTGCNGFPFSRMKRVRTAPESP